MLAGQQEGKFPVQFNVGSQVCSTKGSTGNYDVTKGSTGNYDVTKGSTGNYDVTGLLQRHISANILMM